MKLYKILTYTLLLFFIIVKTVFATTYYVKPASQGGNDKANGLSDATAWATINKVNSTVSGTGDDVYFKCGGTWAKQRLYVDWSGSSENRAIVGAYYGTGTIGVQGNKPIFDGELIAPNSFEQGLVHVVGGSHITIENFKVVNSMGHGVFFSKNTDYGVAKNVDTENTDNGGILWYFSDNGKAESCNVTLAGMKHHRGEIGGWPCALGAYYSKGLVVSKCKVFRVHTEGIGLYKNAHDGIVENCLVYASEKYGIYIDGSHNCIIKNNMVYGTTETGFHRSNRMAGTAIGFDDEGWVTKNVSDIVISGNYIAYCLRGIFLGVPDDYTADNIQIYNNTIVDCYVSVMVGYHFSNSHFTNNIIWNPSGGDQIYKFGWDYNGLAFDYNMWGAPVAENFKGKNDIVSTPLIKKTSGWQGLTSGSLSGSEFSLQENSKAINSGKSLDVVHKEIPEPENSKWPSAVKTYDQNLHGTGWEIGASIYIEPIASSKIIAPSNLKIQ